MLVQGVINKNKGFIAFINNFITLIISFSIIVNLNKIRINIILYNQTRFIKTC